VRLSVLIPIYNGIEKTQPSLAELSGAIRDIPASVLDISVIIIDDGSTDGSAGWIRDHYPEFTVLKGCGDLWWSGAMCLGARHALDTFTADYVLCWNNDIRPARDYFVQLGRILAREEHVLLGSKLLLLDAPNTIFSYGCNFDPVTGRHVLIGTGRADQTLFAEPLDVDWAGGMGTVVHRSVFERIGFWDDKAFPQYHGDSDFCLRAKAAGIKLQIRPELRVWNDKSSSGVRHRGRWAPFFHSFVRKNSNYHFPTQWRFYRRHSTSPRAYISLATFYLGYIGGFLKWKMLAKLGYQHS